MGFDPFAWLDQHVNLESVGLPPGVSRRTATPSLARMEALADLLGSPQREYPILHVTGTNGKTSVARIATALLGAVGLSTGTYTSPHLERVHERIAWADEPIAHEALAALLTHLSAVEPHLPEHPSYFEIVTGAALRFFADVAVDAAVVEVGVGGGFDATNVCDGRVALVTNVTIDHVELLGPTREEIAREKAGIVKAGCEALVIGEEDPALRRIFLERGAPRALVRDTDFGVTSNRFAHGGRALDLFTPGRTYTDVFLPLHGAHQADNAVIALVGVECFLGNELEPSLVCDALARVRSPGRLEVVGHRPLVLLDGAHNVAGARALCGALAEEFPFSSRTLVVGLLREKEPHEMLAALEVATASRLVCCRPPSPRALAPELVAAAAEDLGMAGDRVDVVDDVAAAVDRALELTPADGQLVVTGSLYVVGAARSVLVRED